MSEDGCCGGGCGCHHEGKEKKEGYNEEEEQEEMSTDDLAESNNLILSALIEVLIKKGTVTQEEIDKEVESIANEEEQDGTASAH